jgi:6-phosphogluconolactonase
MFVPDRGADRLYVYAVAGPYSVSQVRNITLPPGTGPRHITFHTFNCTRTYMYLVSELDNTVRVFTLDGVSNLAQESPATGNSELDITLQQTISTIGLGTNRTVPDYRRLAAEVALSKDGKFAYVSNRDTTTYASDTLAVFSVNPDPKKDQAHLTYLGHNVTYGKIPRHFSLSPDLESQYLAVANEVSQSLLILERGPSGFMSAVRGNLSLGSLDVTQNLGPTAVIWG